MAHALPNCIRGTSSRFVRSNSVARAYPSHTPHRLPCPSRLSRRYAWYTPGMNSDKRSSRISPPMGVHLVVSGVVRVAVVPVNAFSGVVAWDAAPSATPSPPTGPRSGELAPECRRVAQSVAASGRYLSGDVGSLRDRTASPPRWVCRARVIGIFAPSRAA